MRRNITSPKSPSSSSCGGGYGGYGGGATSPVESKSRLEQLRSSRDAVPPPTGGCFDAVSYDVRRQNMRQNMLTRSQTRRLKKEKQSTSAARAYEHEQKMEDPVLSSVGAHMKTKTRWHNSASTSINFDVEIFFTLKMNEDHDSTNGDEIGLKKKCSTRFHYMVPKKLWQIYCRNAAVEEKSCASSLHMLDTARIQKSSKNDLKRIAGSIIQCLNLNYMNESDFKRSYLVSSIFNGVELVGYNTESEFVVLHRWNDIVSEVKASGESLSLVSQMPSGQEGLSNLMNEVGGDGLSSSSVVGGGSSIVSGSSDEANVGEESQYPFPGMQTDDDTSENRKSWKEMCEIIAPPDHESVQKAYSILQDAFFDSQSAINKYFSNGYKSDDSMPDLE